MGAFVEAVSNKVSTPLEFKSVCHSCQFKRLVEISTVLKRLDSPWIVTKNCWLVTAFISSLKSPCARFVTNNQLHSAKLARPAGLNRMDRRTERRTEFFIRTFRLPLQGVTRFSHHPLQRQADSQEKFKHMDRSIRAHPRSTVVMDSDNFKIIARGRNTTKLTRKLRRAGKKRGVPVIFQRPDENVVWILRNRPVL